MKETKDMVLVPREQLAIIVKNYCIANYSVMLFAQLAEIRKLEIFLSTTQVCSLLDITRLEVERARSNGYIKSFEIEGVIVYSAFDIARLAEKVHRSARMALINCLPSIDLDKLPGIPK